MLDENTGAVDIFLSRVTLMATGGVGAVYTTTTNPLRSYWRRDSHGLSSQRHRPRHGVHTVPPHSTVPSELGITPENNGEDTPVDPAPLTEERRKQLVSVEGRGRAGQGVGA